MNVSGVIRKRRNDLGLSRKDLATAAGVSYNRMERIENDDISPSIVNGDLARISGVLSLPTIAAWSKIEEEI
jgi:predicted transcriptional regulator